MSIKICVLSDGVRVIGDFYEVTSAFKKVVGYGDRRKPSITGNEDDQSVSIIIRNKK